MTVSRLRIGSAVALWVQALLLASVGHAQTPPAAPGQAPAAATTGTASDAPAPPANPAECPPAPARTSETRVGEVPRHQATADHACFPQLQREFASGPEVTKACLECHNRAAEQIMQTSHWTWICPRAKAELAQRQGRAVGKGEHVINNFCIALATNEPRCTSCHAGYGWRDNTFDFDDQTAVDCLVCHDTTGTYKKFPTAAGHPVYHPTEWPKGSGKMWQPPDLADLARHVGEPSRGNCGSCHFFGGGGEGVKHGDLDLSLFHPTRKLDVHMAEDGANFECTQCHTTVNHVISGRCFTIPAYDQRQFVLPGTRKNLLACESCHDRAPHHDSKLNDHTDKVACQACHIPYFAPQKPTKMWWDWSQAGRRDDKGKPVEIEQRILPEGVSPDDPDAARLGVEEHVYSGLKGEFIWALRATPEYRWNNGRVTHTFIGDPIDDVTPGRDTGSLRGHYDRIDLSRPVIKINALHGDYHDPDARIWPVKIHRGKQPYDPVNKVLAVVNLFPSTKDNQTAYWKYFDWDKAIAAGMAGVGQPYSGKYDFIQTEMYWPLSHMVTPKEDALRCEACHQREGRLAALTGFYMPGRDRSRALDLAGLSAMILALFGVGVHTALRIAGRRRRESR